LFSAVITNIKTPYSTQGHFNYAGSTDSMQLSHADTAHRKKNTYRQLSLV